MPIRFRCPDCRKKIEAPDKLAGRTIDCPRCGRPLSIPEEAAAGALPMAAADALPPAVAPAPRQRKPRPEPEVSLVRPAMQIDFEDLIDMTAMVDIVFFLLIFFLVTSMHALDATIPLPAPSPQDAAESKGSSTSASESDDSSVVVNIDANDVIRIEGTEVFSPQDLLFRLRDLRNGAGHPDKLLVVGSGDASHGVTVMVLDAGHDVGMASVKLAVRDEIE